MRARSAEVRHHLLCEHELRRFGAAGEVPIDDAERLVRAAAPVAARLKGAQRAFDWTRDGLKAQNLVGIVAAPGTTCEILPKVDRDAPANHPGLRRQLIRMLGVAHDLPIAVDAATALDTQNETALEILIARFAALVVTALWRGLPHGYVAREEDLPALRGRLDTIRQFTVLAASPQRLACRFDEFSPDVPLNRVVKAAVTRLAQLTRSAANARTLHELALVYADVAAVPRGPLAVERVAINRGNAHWRAPIRLAQLILGDRFQSSATGPDDGWALLFDMNLLFERYVATLVERVAPASGWQVTRQGGNRPCLQPEDGGGGLFATSPDLMLRRGADLVVIDTKWKRLDHPARDAKMGISQADLYQMMAYAQVYGTERLLLLYPHHHALPAQLAATHRVAAGPVRLTVATVDVGSHAAALADLQALLGDALALAA